jgi:hypothetical protein
MGDGGGLRRVAGGLKEDTGGKHLMAIEVSVALGCALRFVEVGGSLTESVVVGRKIREDNALEVEDND